MLVNLFCWFYITVSAFLFGIAGMKVLKKVNGYSCFEADTILVFGVCLLTVFAQSFSLFYKVGAAANAVLVLLDIGFFYIFRKDIFAVIKIWKENKTALKYIVLVIGVLTIIFLKYASKPVVVYDTYLYHAQAVRWIEEYGIVPGLGNLHNRLAYNSSLLPLQALFSLKFMWGGRSLHSINGFIGLLLISYAVCSLKVLRTHKFHGSDFFRIILIFYIVSQNDVISSLNTDFFALAMVLYLLIKWMTLTEEKETPVEAYVCLCLLCIFSVSLKLSAAMIMLLVLSALVKLIRKRQWKELGIYAVLGILVILPFLIRNVIISGYLIYPYPELDIFSFNWKMPEYTLFYDRNEVKSWAMGVRDGNRYRVPFTEWFPVWIEDLSRFQKLEVYIFPLSVLFAVGIAVWKTIKYKMADYFCIVVTITAIVLFWFWGAPAIRFGGVFLLLLPCFVIGNAAEYLNSRIQTDSASLIIMLICIMYYINPVIVELTEGEFENKVWEKDYEKVECREVYLAGEAFYLPAEGDLTGYWSFPAAPYEDQMTLIELRGERLKDGFKMKEDYKNAFVTNSGSIKETNIFE